MSIVFEPSRKSIGRRVGGVSVKKNPTLGRTASGLPEGIMCSWMIRSLPFSRRHAMSAGSITGVMPGVQPSAWLSGLCVPSENIPPSKPGSGSSASSLRDARVASMPSVA